MADVSDFYKWLIEQGHTAIFQWVTVWLASGIGLIQIIQTIYTSSSDFPPSLKLYLNIIYVLLTLLMVFSIHRIFNIMRNQDRWAMRMDDNIRGIFMATRGISRFLLSNSIYEIICIIVNLSVCLLYLFII
jgi:hypothetical protein